MEVILIQDVQNLGFAHDVVKVKPGYGRNYLIPEGLAILATPSSKKAHTEMIRQKAYKEQKVIKSAEEFAKLLKNVIVKIGAKAAPNGKIYGSVNALQISQALKDQFDYDVDRKKIHVDGESIKELGTYTATVTLHKEIKVDITFEVFAE